MFHFCATRSHYPYSKKYRDPGSISPSYVCTMQTTAAPFVGPTVPNIKSNVGRNGNHNLGHSKRGTRIRSRCVARSFRLSTRFQRSSFQVCSQRHNTHICHACAISQSIENHDTTACCGSVPKEPILSQTLVLPNRK